MRLPRRQWPNVGHGVAKLEIKKEEIHYKLHQQPSGEESCLFTKSVLKVTKNYMLPTALGLPEDMSHCSVLALEV